MHPLYAPIASMNFLCDRDLEYGFRAEQGNNSKICRTGGSYRSITRFANRFTSIRFNDSIVFAIIHCFRATGVLSSKYSSSLKSMILNTAVKNVDARAFISTYSRRLPVLIRAVTFFTSFASSSSLCFAINSARSSLPISSPILIDEQTEQLHGKSSNSLRLSSPSSI